MSTLSSLSGASPSGSLTTSSSSSPSPISVNGLVSGLNTSAIIHGTLELKVGNAATSITIDSSNDTLQGLADAVNASGAAVTAYIINDGSGAGQQGYRLVLASKATGTSNQVSVVNHLAASGSG